MKLLPTILETEENSNHAKRKTAERIIASYSGIIRLYALIRFKIIHVRFLEEMEQYLPENGLILDLGCGFGLFALYMAISKPNTQIVGLDVNQKRLDIARASAEKLGVRNVTFVHQDLRAWRPDQKIAGAYALDVFHHIPVESGNQLLCELGAHLEPGGAFLLKDIDTGARGMLAFTFVLDLLMCPRDEFFYRSASVWQQQLARAGFAPIYLHYLWDVLPYPHVLLICSKPKREE